MLSAHGFIFTSLWLSRSVPPFGPIHPTDGLIIGPDTGGLLISPGIMTFPLMELGGPIQVLCIVLGSK